MRKRFLIFCITICSLVLAVPLITFSYNFLSEFLSEPYNPEKHPLAIMRFGHGPKVLFIHGLAGSSNYWQSRLGDFGTDHDVILVDLLGFGLSPKPKSSYDLDVHVKAVSTMVAKEVSPGSDKILIVAHSMGAMIALKLVEDFPERFSGAVLISLPIFKNKDDAATAISRISPMYAATFNGDVLMRLSCYLRDFYRFEFLAHYFNLPADVFFDGTKHTWHSLAGSLRNTVAATNSEQLVLAANNKSLMFIHGDKDEIAPFERVKEISAKVQKPFYAIAGGDHHVFISHPQEILALIRGFEARSSH